jgi:hypothetical protein
LNRIGPTGPIEVVASQVDWIVPPGGTISVRTKSIWTYEIGNSTGANGLFVSEEDLSYNIR